MLKQLIVTITALVLMNSAINFTFADEPIYEDNYGAEIGCFAWKNKKVNINAGKQSAEMWFQDVYGSKSDDNEPQKEKAIIIATKGDNDKKSGHYNSLDKQIEAWEWY